MHYQIYISMAGNITFTIIKPKAVENGHIGPILFKIHEGGFKISAMRMMWLTRGEAERFYEVHKERPFYRDLVEFMTSGPIVVAVLKKENAVADYRKLIGNTDPAKAEEGAHVFRHAQGPEPADGQGLVQLLSGNGQGRGEGKYIAHGEFEAHPPG